MTKAMYGFQESDTTELRTAIINYILVTHGVVNDCYNTAKVNKILHRDLKTWIKKIACHPNEAIASDVPRTLLTAEEMCHICILIMETKRRLELLLFAQAMNQHLGY
ncbi:MAG: hypothetical protein ACK521_02080 [bacterium]|jgi:hypothetical protein